MISMDVNSSASSHQRCGEALSAGAFGASLIILGLGRAIWRTDEIQIGRCLFPALAPKFRNKSPIVVRQPRSGSMFIEISVKLNPHSFRSEMDDRSTLNS